MPRDSDDERMEADGLQHRCHQHARISTGADLLLQEIGRQADALPGALEACGRRRVDNARLTQCVKHRRGLGSHPVGVLGLVPVKR